MFRPGNGLCTEHVDYNGIRKLKEHLLTLFLWQFNQLFFLFLTKFNCFTRLRFSLFFLALDSFD
jgi:hypothetical protein